MQKNKNLEDVKLETAIKNKNKNYIKKNVEERIIDMLVQTQKLKEVFSKKQLNTIKNIIEQIEK